MALCFTKSDPEKMSVLAVLAKPTKTFLDRDDSVEEITEPVVLVQSTVTGKISDLAVLAKPIF